MAHSEQPTGGNHGPTTAKRPTTPPKPAAAIHHRPGVQATATQRQFPATTSTNVGYALPAEEAREIVRVAVKQHWDLQALVQAAKISTPQHLNHRVQITPTNAALGMRHLWQTTGDDLMGLATIGLPPAHYDRSPSPCAAHPICPPRSNAMTNSAPPSPACPP